LGALLDQVNEKQKENVAMREKLEEMAREIYNGRRELARLAREAQQQEERFKKKERALLEEIQKLALNQKEALPQLVKTADGEIDGHPCEIWGTISRTHRGREDGPCYFCLNMLKAKTMLGLAKAERRYPHAGERRRGHI